MIKFGKEFIKRLLYFSNVNWLLARMRPHSIVLGLHRVIQDDKGLLNARIEHMTPSMLERIIQYLRLLGYKFVPLSNLIGKEEARMVAITFDDGFQDVYQNAYPILKKHAIPFTVFLTTSTADSQELLWQHKLYASIDRLPPEKQVATLKKYGLFDDNNYSLFELLDYIIHTKDPRFLESITLRVAEEAELTKQEQREQAEALYLKEDQIKKMVNHGLELHAHGHKHWSLPTLNYEQTKTELEECLIRIEGLMGTKPIYYAPSFGKRNSSLKKVALENEIAAIFCTNPGLIQSKSKAQVLPRIMTVNVLGLSIELTRVYLRDLLSL